MSSSRATSPVRVARATTPGPTPSKKVRVAAPWRVASRLTAFTKAAAALEKFSLESPTKASAKEVVDDEKRSVSPASVTEEAKAPKEKATELQDTTDDDDWRFQYVGEVELPECEWQILSRVDASDLSHCLSRRASAQGVHPPLRPLPHPVP